MATINPQILAQVGTNVSKSDLNAKPTRTESGKDALLSTALKKNLAANTEQKAFATSDDVNLKLKSLVNKLLDTIQSRPGGVARQQDRLNFAPNFGNEVKALAVDMAKSELFSEVLTKLEQILKPMSELKADNFAPLFKNSGVFFEAKLSAAINSSQTLPQSFHSLLNAIKSISSPEISTQIATLADKDLDPQSSLNELKAILTAQKGANAEVVRNSAFKTLLNLGDKIENFKSYIAKSPILAQDNIQKLAANILKSLQKMETNFKAELGKPENLAFKDTNFIKDLSQSFNKVVQTLKNIVDGKANVPINSALNKNALPSNLPQSVLNSNLKAANSTLNSPPNSTANAKFAEIIEQKPSVNSSTNSLSIPSENESVNEKATQNLSTNSKPNLDENLKEFSSKINAQKSVNLSSNSKENLSSKPENTQSQATQKSEIQEQKQNVNLNANADESENLTQKNSENLSKNEANLKENLPKNTPNLNEPKNATKPENTQNQATQNAQAKANLNPNLSSNSTQNFAQNLNQNQPQNPTQNLNQNQAQNANLTQNLNAQNQANIKNLIFADENAKMPELENLSKELSNLARKANEGLRQLDANAQNARTNLADIKNLEHKLNQASKDLGQIAPRDVSQLSAELKNDIKSTLLQTAQLAKDGGNEAVANHANRLLAQIEFNQLLSLANDSLNANLPLFWEDLSESRVSFKRGKKDKYYAQIKLGFAKLGQLDILIALKQDKYLDINIMAEDKAFRARIYDHAHELKRALSKVGLLSANFFVGDIIRTSFAPPKTERNYEFQMGIDKKA